MANYRNVSVAFWTDPKVVDEFTPEDRYIYFYCLTNPHTNLCGCYEVSVKQIANETGYNEDTVRRLLKRLDKDHDVIRYSATTKELLVLNWYRYNWSASEKLNKPLLDGICAVKNDGFREYLADRYNERDSVTQPYDGRVEARHREAAALPVPASDDARPGGAPPPEKQVKHKYGQYGWVRLTDAEYSRLTADLGPEELQRCITYIDESAQSNGNKNKWKDWNLVIRKCNRQRWGISRYGAPASQAQGALEDLQVLHRQFSEEG